jgi:membrane-bound metal-dependent hydrolase YbcI (DUF457 family)
VDTITHGIAGALISKAAFGGRDLISPGSMNRQRVITWSLMLGAIFPDSDVVREFFSHNPMLMLTWHRSITHSLLCLPIWAVLLAGLTRLVVKWRKWEAPSFIALCGIWAIGILSHIFLDLLTTFGTMIWSPLEWSRPAWDILFIVDFSFTAIVLIPQLLAWIYEEPKQIKWRAILLWVVFLPAPFLISKIGKNVGAPISDATVLTAIVLLTALVLLPAVRGAGLQIGYRNWNRAGFVVAVCYLAAAIYAHQVAYGRIQEFAAEQNLQVEAIGALPLPPSLWHWDGLVRAPRGVYEFRMDLSEGFLQTIKPGAGNSSPKVIEHTYYPDALPNPWIDEARQLPEVQKVLWFARFPVTRFHKEGDEAVVEFSDLRFPHMQPGRAASFTYRVRFSSSGSVIAKGWMGR